MGRTIFRVIIGLLLAGLLLWALKRSDLHGILQRLINRIAELGPWGPILFILTFALCVVLFVPATVFTLSGGAVFGLGPGFLYVVLGANVGAIACFLLAKHFLRHWLAEKIRKQPKLAALDAAVGAEGWKIAVLSRLSPIFPFAFLNYAYGVSRLSCWTFAWSTFIGTLPALFAYVYVGSLARQTVSAPMTQTRAILYGVGGVATLAVAFLLTRTARRILGQKLHEPKG